MLLQLVVASLLAGTAQAEPSTASVRALAHAGAAQRLVAIARDHSDTLREALSQSLRSAVSSSAAEKQLQVRAARRLAAAYATAWRDSFLVRDVERFARWNEAAQAGRLAADSLRKAGNRALLQDGVPAAMRLWRASLRSAASLRDSVAYAAAQGNLGAGFYRAGQSDSAEYYLTRSHALSRTLGDRRTMANALGLLASLRKDAGNLDQAARLYTAASSLRERAGDTRGVAADQNNLGLIARDLGELSRAAAAFERALTLNRAAGRLELQALNLTNLAGVHSTVGEYAEADRRLGEALELQRRTGARAETAYTLHERGLLRIRRGDYAGSVADLRAALRVHEAAGASVEAALVGVDLAGVLMARGDPQGSITALRQAEARALATGASAGVLADIALAHGELAIELNAYQQASDHFAAAEQRYRAANEDFGLARVADARALLLQLRGDYTGAQAALAAAASAYARTGDVRATALAHLSMAYVQLQLSDTIAARQSVALAEGALRDAGDPVGEAATLLAHADVAMARGTPRVAEARYREGIAKLGTGSAADTKWRLHAGLAAALRQQGAIPEAVAALRAAVKEIDRSALLLRAPERRSAYRSDKLGVLAQLALVEWERGDVVSAFAASEKMRAQHLLATLGRGGISGKRTQLLEEQDLRRQIGELMSMLEQPESARVSREASSPTPPTAGVRDALYRAQTRYTRLIMDLRDHDPGYADLVAPRTATAASVARALRPDEVLIEYLVTDSTTLAFVISDGRAAVVDLGIPRRQLAPLVDFAHRVTLRRDSLWRAPLTRLHDLLIAPIEATGRLRGKRGLIIVPHAELHFVPFAALVNRKRGTFMVRDLDISYAPSASVWLRLRHSDTRRRPGVLALAPRVDVLPHSGVEIRGIERIYGRGATTLAGSAVSEAALRAGLRRAGVVHLATLGVLNRQNPLFSFVDLGGTRGRRERLEVHEVFELDLDGQLIVLSACQTGVGAGTLADVPPGDDWVGLMQSFISAGAGGVVASLWPINDRATARLMTAFHQHLKAGRSEAAAMAEAQRAALRRAATAHPYYWAAFTVHSGR